MSRTEHKVILHSIDKIQVLGFALRKKKKKSYPMNTTACAVGQTHILSMCHTECGVTH